jgi:hypothetical protein
MLPAVANNQSSHKKYSEQKHSTSLNNTHLFNQSINQSITKIAMAVSEQHMNDYVTRMQSNRGRRSQEEERRKEEQIAEDATREIE